MKEDEHTPEPPAQFAEQKTPEPPGLPGTQETADPSREQHNDTDPKKDASDPHAQKGA